MCVCLCVMCCHLSNIIHARTAETLMADFHIEVVHPALNVAKDWTIVWKISAAVSSTIQHMHYTIIEYVLWLHFIINDFIIL